MDFVTYGQWCANKLDAAIEQGLELEVPCTTCDGEGVVTCRHCEHQHDCKECGGSGLEDILTSEIKPESATKIFKINDYFNEMIETFKFLAFVKNKPLIDVVGPFIVYYRKEFQRWGGTW